VLDNGSSYVSHQTMAWLAAHPWFTVCHTPAPTRRRAARRPGQLDQDPPGVIRDLWPIGDELPAHDPKRILGFARSLRTAVQANGAGF
jgi:hypothetical protein